jgi:aminoglycoside phosphotransferase (APT) family kinase protein
MDLRRTDLGAPLASGRTADVYALGDDRVLRRYHPGIAVEREVAYMEHVTRFGYPVPKIYESGGTDIIMERVDGLTMRDAFAAGQIDIETGAAALAEMLNRLRRIPGRDGTGSTLHLDLHGENMLFGPAGPVVIDWANADDGDPDLDVALSVTILAQMILEPNEAALAPAVCVLLNLVLAQVEGQPLRGLDEAVARRLANPTMSPDERDRLPAAGDLVRAAWKSGR